MTYIFCWLTRSLFSLISLESRKNTTLLKKIKQKIPFNAFVCLKDFLQVSKHLSMEEKKAKNLRGSNEQKVYISLHEFKVVDGRLVAQKSHQITCKSWKKVSKRRSIETNDDKLLRPSPAPHRHHFQKKEPKNFLASLPGKHKERRANHKNAAVVTPQKS